jgi:tripartite-type tricarboxylate transporter receptor subunit TctC
MTKLPAILVALVLAAAAPALAEERFPARPITIVDPYPPGGSIDTLVTALAKPLQRILQQAVVVTYQPGAGGADGTAAVARRPADGYTVVVVASSFVSIPEFERLQKRPPPYSTDELTGVALLSAEPVVLIANPSLPAKTARQFIALAKAHPGELVVAAAGRFGQSHLVMTLLEHAAGVRFRPLFAEGGGPALSAVLSGHAAAYTAPLSAATPHITSGEVRALAHSGTGRLPSFPDLPALKELGIDVEFYSWFAMFAPAQTPAPALDTLRGALRQAVRDPDFRAAMQKANLRIDYRDGDGFDLWYAREKKRIIDAVGTVGAATGR